MNYYFIKKHHHSTSLTLFGKIIFRFLLLSLILTPFFMFLFIERELYILAACSSFIAYTWVAFLFLFISIHMFFDLIFYVLSKKNHNFSDKSLSKVFYLTFILSIIILTYGYFEAENIKIDKVLLKSKKLSSLSKPLKIVQISDTHFSPVKGASLAKKITGIIKNEEPDIIFMTGDFSDKGVKEKAEIAALFQEIKPKWGKFAVTGNHEYIAGIDESCDFIKEAGFTLLRNENVRLGDLITIVGTDDEIASSFNEKRPDELKVLQKAASDKFTIYLKHQPFVNESWCKYFDLQLSGHTHAGQIFPFSLLVRLAFRYVKGLHEVRKNTYLYINRGSGTWGPPFRFLAPPEITVILLKGD